MSENMGVFKDFISKNKVPFIFTYLKYEPDKEHRNVKHQDVDSIFCTSLLYLKDKTTVWLHVDNVNLPELFYLGDVVFMDPRQEHEVTNCIPNEVRQVLVLTLW